MASEEYGQRTINCNIFGSLLAGEFIEQSSNHPHNKVRMAKAFLWVARQIQADLSLRSIEISKKFQQALLTNHQNIELGQLFAVESTEITPDYIGKLCNTINNV